MTEKEIYKKYKNPPVKFSSYAYHPISSGRFTVDNKIFDTGTDLRTAERLKEYADCGFDILFLQNVTYFGEPFKNSTLKKLMDTAADVGIGKIIVFDYRLALLGKREKSLIGGGVRKTKTCFGSEKEAAEYLSDISFGSEEELCGYVKDCMKEYALHPAFYGVLLSDEPSYKRFDAIGEITKAVKSVKENAFVHVNLLPMIDGVIEQFAEEYSTLEDAYIKYLAAYADKVGLDYVQYDDYPMLETTGKSEIGTNCLRCLQITADFCKKRGLTFYCVAQSTAMYMRDRRVFRTPSKRDMLWQVNHLLGFGIKRIAYFTYFRKAQNSSSGEYFPDGTAMIAQNGEKTPLYFAVRDINAELNELADIVMSFEYSSSTYSVRCPSGKLLDYVTRIESREISGLQVVSQDKNSLFLICALSRGDEKLYMIQNAEDPERAEECDGKEITLRFDGADELFMFAFGNIRKTEKNSAAEIKLGAGEAMFVLPIKKEK